MRRARSPGANTTKPGKFEQADTGTVFLDEIGDVPGAIQVKLLRILQEREFERLGSNKTRHIDVRVLAATNVDLRAALEQGTFREDLYYRLNVLPINIPPLRERKEDIPSLADHFSEVAEGSGNAGGIDFATPRLSGCSAITGRGMCGSWRMSSNAAWCWRSGKVLEAGDIKLDMAPQGARCGCRIIFCRTA